MSIHYLVGEYRFFIEIFKADISSIYKTHLSIEQFQGTISSENTHIQDGIKGSEGD